jgi:uncharacterized protein (DUF433 family)
MIFENHLKIGSGFYTISDVAKILRLPYQRVSMWVNRYWDGELGKEYENKYSWVVDGSKAVSFHTLIEFYVLYLFAESGVQTRKVLNAHKELSTMFNSSFPFAQKRILENIQTDGKRIFFYLNNNILSLDGTKQFNLSFIEMFFKNLEFDKDLLATKFWPLGKNRSVIIDPKRQFGHPVVGKTNIYPETLFNLYKSGEPINFIAFTYELDEKDVKDAIMFCEAA